MLKLRLKKPAFKLSWVGSRSWIKKNVARIQNMEIKHSWKVFYHPSLDLRDPEHYIIQNQAAVPLYSCYSWPVRIWFSLFLVCPSTTPSHLASFLNLSRSCITWRDGIKLQLKENSEAQSHQQRKNKNKRVSMTGHARNWPFTSYSTNLESF